MGEEWGNVQLEDLYEQYSDAIFRFVLLHTGDSQHAEDITQEVFIRAYKGLGQFEGRSSYKTWLYTIARNTTHDFYRKKRPIAFLPSFFQNQPEVTEMTPSEIAELGEGVALLYEALSKLKPHYREIIVLRQIKEFSIKETAEVLGCSEAKVKSTTHRAMAALKKELNVEGFQHESVQS
ncbi:MULTISPECIES: RNA polymerase sigma factor [Bacillaceae]|uniref:RNA polymerase sigma factor n=1 Tax=Evansella alkalicola TaxID=745819 RepID=A0ABS6JYL8_9BACI|nr:RNA polymerase sigma factor [Litchfieldia alkalitelluris]MBU9722190.1 RNA polymerase sigma factor [Bacillus alkalicola]